MNEIEIRLAGLLQELGVSQASIKRNADFFSDLNIDPFQFLNMILSIEKEFKIIVPDSDIFQLETISGAIDYIDRKMTYPYSLN